MAEFCWTDESNWTRHDESLHKETGVGLGVHRFDRDAKRDARRARNVRRESSDKTAHLLTTHAKQESRQL